MDELLRCAQHGGNQHQAGHGAEDNGIPEYAGHRHQRLPGRIRGGNGCSGHGGGPHAGFVGEQASGGAAAGRGENRAAYKAAHWGTGDEGSGDNDLERLGHILPVDPQHGQTAQQVQSGHGGDQLFAALGNGANAPQNYGGGQNYGAQAGENGGNLGPEDGG